ncbi:MULTISPECIES: ABC transporter ATP-binding protein [unclassified Frigoribacterium]|uniref:ABC transporter ATP-binding protein n=1 Tax=unclassified Frigoribacterium TaxID=2627005 RepID=UPI000700EBDD|nr:MULTISPECIES: ABC transporter ATP-binding protein [unclassified Frigoribacterium]KQO46556.1 ABC transporter [Frigoribacterium sp. Leaf254]KQT38649.1 ABC transporter [Frigoribacterium sp. Leaf415]
MSSDTRARTTTSDGQEARVDPPAAPRSRWGRRPQPEGPRATFRQLLPYLFEHKKVMAFIIVLSVLGAAASLGQPLLVQQVISAVQQGVTLGPLVWALVALVVVAGLISGFQHYLLQRTGEGVVLSSRRRLVGRMLRLPISQFDTRRTGDLVSRVGSDTTLLRAVLTQGLVEAIGGSLTFVGALVGMFLIDPVLLGLTVLVVAVSVVVVVLLSGRIRVASRQAQEKVGDLTAAVERAISSVRTIRASGATDREIVAVERDAEGAYQRGLQVARISALVVPISSVALQVSFLVVLGVGGYRVASGAIEIASLVSFVLFLFLMIMPLGQALGAVLSVNQALGALGRIQEILDLPSETDGDERLAAEVATREVGAGDGPDTGDDIAVRFDDVHFRYPDSPVATGTATGDSRVSDEPGHDSGVGPVDDDLTVLRGVSFSVPVGKRTALVGPSGAGKSTILSLIERFYDPTSGAVRVGGADVRTLDRGDLRSRIGYVEQDAPVLAGTIRDNLTLGSPEATDDDCRRVLEAVNLTAVLERGDQGLDAQVGEDGVMLSGGERQRLAIARTLLNAPPILLLDESTSSLDGLNEQRLREAIDAVAENRTLIVIAHRLSTVVDSDQIVVVEAGRVVGVGTHSELVQTTPLYKDLAKHQLLV